VLGTLMPKKNKKMLLSSRKISVLPNGLLSLKIVEKNPKCPNYPKYKLQTMY